MPDNKLQPPAQRRPRRLRWLLAVFVLLVIGGAVTAQQYLQSNAQPPVRTALVERGDVERTVTAIGKLKPREYVDVRTQVSGQLHKVDVASCHRVKRGDLIGEQDPTVHEQRLRQSQPNP